MFMTELVIKPVNGNEWELTENLIYSDDYKDDVIVVPKGFQMGLASIPRLLTWLFPVHGKHTRAAVVHDWLYANKGKLLYVTYTRKEADFVFKTAMKELGVNWFKRNMMYTAVRTSGWLYWRD